MANKNHVLKYVDDVVNWVMIWRQTMDHIVYISPDE